MLDIPTPRVFATVYSGETPSHEETLAELATAYGKLLESGWKRDGLTQRRIDAIRWALARVSGSPLERGE